ncbi:MAG: HTH domain-containing addiction module [Comamonadaceae bacterium]|nr:MAG: HTH domain-containing addiction module [Comamonadaceae bacterium]
MKITLPVDEPAAQRAHETAQQMGKNLNQVVCDDLEQRGDGARRAQQWPPHESRCLSSPARLEGWRFDRDEAHER